MRWNAGTALSTAWVSVGVGSYLVLPTSAPFLLPLTALAPLFWYPHKDLARQLRGRSVPARVLAAAAAYLLINATWSTAQERALIGVATFFVASVVVHVVARTMPFLNREPLRAMSVGFYTGYAICALLICFEIFLDHPLHLRFFAHFPGLTPQMDDVVIEAGIAKGLPSYFLNRNIAALVFLLWPALLVASRLAASRDVRGILLAGLTPAIPAIFASDHDTSKLAVVGGAAAFSLLMLVPRFAKPLMVAGWTLACIAVAPLASVAHNNLQLHTAAWLPNSARDRIVLWSFTASKIHEAPILGHGMVSTRQFGLLSKEQPVFEPGTPYILTTGPHSHNVYLQVWFDTGLVGAVFLLTIGLLILRAISRSAADTQPMLYATFVSNAMLAAASFSIWTHWFLASYALSTAFAIMAHKFATTAPTDENLR